MATTENPKPAKSEGMDRQTLVLILVALLVAVAAFGLSRALSKDVIVQGVRVEANAPLNETFARLLTTHSIVMETDYASSTNDTRNSAVGTMAIDLNYRLALVGKNVTNVGILPGDKVIGCKARDPNNATCKADQGVLPSLACAEEKCQNPVIRITIGSYNGLRVNANQLTIEGDVPFFTDATNRGQISTLIANSAPQ